MVSEQKWGVIINGIARRRAVKQSIRQIISFFQKEGANYCCETTQYSGNAQHLACQMVNKGVNHILVIGGDGTLNEVLNGVLTSGIADKQEMAIAVLPYGTGNDWARYWGIRPSIDIVKYLSNFSYHRVDVGLLQYYDEGESKSRHFFNCAGFGVDAHVIKITNKLKTKIKAGAWAYFISILATVFTYRPSRMRIVSDQEEQNDYVFTISVGNGCYSGSGIKQTPRARPDDGVFHASVIRNPTFWEIMSGLFYMFTGKIDKFRCTTTHITKHFSVESDDKKLSCEIDGVSIEGIAPYRISIIPNALKMMVPNF